MKEREIERLNNLKEFETWNSPQKILDNFKILVLERDKDNMEEIIKNNPLYHYKFPMQVYLDIHFLATIFPLQD